MKRILFYSAGSVSSEEWLPHKEPNSKHKGMTWEEFCYKIKNAKAPNGKQYTQKHYNTLYSKHKDEEQEVEKTLAEIRVDNQYRSAIKNKNGVYMGGELFKNGKRGNSTVKSRVFITLDLDSVDISFRELYLLVCNKIFKENLGTPAKNFLIHTTTSHDPDQGRNCYRIIIPLDYEVDPGLWEMASRRIAGWLIDWEEFDNEEDKQEELDRFNEFFDDVSFRIAQCCFWPVPLRGGTYEVEYTVDEGFINIKDILEEDRPSPYSFPGMVKATAPTYSGKSFETLKDDLYGVMGAFVEEYTPQDVIEQFLFDEYEKSHRPNAYTYMHGTSADGLIIYDDRYVVSYQHSDPVNKNSKVDITNKGIDAFHFLCLHLFGCPTAKTNLKKMEQWVIANCDGITGTVAKRKYEETHGGEEMPEWAEYMETHPKTGLFLATKANLDIVVKNDDKLKGLFSREELTGSMMLMEFRPGIGIPAGSYLHVEDEYPCQLRGPHITIVNNYIAHRYGGLRLSNSKDIYEAIEAAADTNKHNAKKLYLESLEPWDGVQRIDNILYHYAGAEDNEYTRAVSRLMCLGIVARVLDPGCVFEYIPILLGEKGSGKSALCRELSRTGQASIKDVFKKDDRSLISQATKNFVVEFGETTKIGDRDLQRLKDLASKTVLQTNKLYSTNEQVAAKISYIFVITANEITFYNDPTGNRRFLIVKCNRFFDKDGEQYWRKSIDGIDVDQIYAEAMYYYLDDFEEPVLPGKFRGIVEQTFKEQTQQESWLQEVLGHVDKPVFKGIHRYSVEVRREYFKALQESFSRIDGEDETDQDLLASAILEVMEANIMSNTERIRPLILKYGLVSRDAICLDQILNELPRVKDTMIRSNKAGKDKKALRSFLSSRGWSSYNRSDKAGGKQLRVFDDSKGTTRKIWTLTRDKK